jgi:HPt (histidine-containing phosphotransfer) domain-containing protein
VERGAVDAAHPMTVERESPILYDESRLLTLFGDEPAVIAELLGMFILATREDLANLSAACECLDAPRVARISHRLKGAAHAVGAEGLRIEAGKLEAAGLSGQLDEAKLSVSRLSSELESLSSHIGRQA